MKPAILITSALTVLALMSFVIKPAHTDTYKVDPKLSTLEWYAQKVTGKHNGTIRLSGGEVRNDHGKFAGSFDIDMTSIENKDIESAEYRAKLEKHLKSADFFDVALFPKAKFVLTSVTQHQQPTTAGFTHSVKGLLTIKDKTNEIKFDAILKIDGNKALCSGSAIVDRSKFDVKYGSKTFFADIGDKMIYDDFTLKFNVVATK